MKFIFILAIIIHPCTFFATQDLSLALKRAQYLLNQTIPTAEEFSSLADIATYKQRVRAFINHENFYRVILRYHQKLYGIGLQTDYLDELMRSDIDRKKNKFAQITCGFSSDDGRLRCAWASEKDSSSQGGCPKAWEEPVTPFWFPQTVAFACPTVLKSCGSDLSRCFIEFSDTDLAASSELGTTLAFDSRQSVVKSLSSQGAGLATAVVIANYPYTKILEPGLTAIDGAIAHLYKQKHHFDLSKLNIAEKVLELVNSIPLTDTKFHLVYTGSSYDQGGVLSTFGWLRRYEKNRSRANQLYQRFLCREFTAELPKIFPQDPGNLRETPGCMGCHATLDPLADFFKVWGEGGELYSGFKSAVASSFGGQNGQYLSDLTDIIRNDNAFSTCTVEHVWNWLIGRTFYADEAPIRAALTNYLITTNYSFRELVFAIATHPIFLAKERGNSLVDDPLSEPPLGEPPGGNILPDCPETVTYTADVEPKISLCATSGCHIENNGRNITALTTETEWTEAAKDAISMMNSGQMPVGSSGPPRIGPVWDLKEAVRCWVERNNL